MELDKNMDLDKKGVRWILVDLDKKRVRWILEGVGGIEENSSHDA